MSLTLLMFFTSPWKTSPVILLSFVKGLSTSFHNSLFKDSPCGMTHGSNKEIPEYVYSLSFESELIIEFVKLKSPLLASFFFIRTK